MLVMLFKLCPCSSVSRLGKRIPIMVSRCAWNSNPLQGQYKRVFRVMLKDGSYTERDLIPGMHFHRNGNPIRCTYIRHNGKNRKCIINNEKGFLDSCSIDDVLDSLNKQYGRNNLASRSDEIL